MPRYVVDAWAWIEYFNATKYGLKAKEFIENCEVYTNAITIAELASKFMREGKNVDELFNAVLSLSKIIEVDANSVKGIGKLHYEVRKTNPNFSFGDASVLHTAQAINAKVLTGDPDFKGLKNVEMLK